MVKAAAELNTFVIMPVADITAEFEKYGDNIIPRLAAAEIEGYKDILKKARIVSIEYDDALLNNLAALKEKIKKISQLSR